MSLTLLFTRFPAKVPFQIVNTKKHIVPKSFIFAVIFTKVGGKLLHHDKTSMTYAEAKERCQALHSSIVEMWTDQEYKEVIEKLIIFFRTIIFIHLLCVADDTKLFKLLMLQP